jgi:hypothetical protein
MLSRWKVSNDIRIHDYRKENISIGKHQLEEGSKIEFVIVKQQLHVILVELNCFVGSASTRGLKAKINGPDVS